MNSRLTIFAKVFANLYALMLKTQNFHWHVHGINFKSLHLMFEEQYNLLFLHIDAIAERMLALGFKVPATLGEIQALKTLKDGHSTLDAQEMLLSLIKDYVSVIQDIDELLKDAEAHHDEATLSMFTDNLLEYEKILWMLKSSADVS